MRLTMLSTFFAAAAVISTFGHGTAKPICQPRLNVSNARLSAPEGLQRTWTAKVDIDALRCATTRGRFEIIFQREKETAQTWSSFEQFEWQTGSLQTGHIDVSVDFWIDEAVQSYAIGATARCPCRQSATRLHEIKARVRSLP